MIAGFRADPAGWTSVGIVLLTVIVSAVFWQRTWDILKGLGRALLFILRGIFSLRITTASNLKPSRRHKMVVPARFDLVQEKDAAKGDFVLANFAEGSVARDVQLDVLSRDARLRSSGFWASVDGGQVGRFKLAFSPDALFGGITFAVEYTDGNGVRKSVDIHVGG